MKRMLAFILVCLLLCAVVLPACTDSQEKQYASRELQWFAEHYPEVADTLATYNAKAPNLHHPLFTDKKWEDMQEQKAQHKWLAQTSWNTRVLDWDISPHGENAGKIYAWQCINTDWWLVRRNNDWFKSTHFVYSFLHNRSGKLQSLVIDTSGNRLEFDAPYLPAESLDGNSIRLSNIEAGSNSSPDLILQPLDFFKGYTISFANLLTDPNTLADFADYYAIQEEEDYGAFPGNIGGKGTKCIFAAESKVVNIFIRIADDGVLETVLCIDDGDNSWSTFDQFCVRGMILEDSAFENRQDIDTESFSFSFVDPNNGMCRLTVSWDSERGLLIS